MKQCPNCGTTNDDGNTFCLACGTRLPEAASASNASNTSSGSDESWYYVDNGDSKGPFDKNAFLELIVDQTITPETYVWSRGMKEWTRLKNTSLYSSTSADSSASGSDASSAGSSSSYSDYSSAGSNGYDSGSSASYSGSSSYTGGSSSSAGYNAQNDSNSGGSWNDSGSSSSESQEWYYAINGRSYGPFSQSVMSGYIRQGVLDGNSLVWKSDFTEWKPLSDTTLASELPASSVNGPYGGSTQSWSSQNGNGTNVNVNIHMDSQRRAPMSSIPTRSPISCLVLSILTCGIYGIVWMFQLTDNVNQLCRERGIPEGPSPIAVLLLGMLTCGIYTLYYYYKLGANLYQCSDGIGSDNSLILVLLAFFGLPIISLMIAQSQLNTIVEQSRR